MDYLLRELPNVNVDFADEDGRTALHAAARGGQPAAARLLVRWGASLSARDGTNLRPIDVVTGRLGRSTRTDTERYRRDTAVADALVAEEERRGQPPVQQ